MLRSTVGFSQNRDIIALVHKILCTYKVLDIVRNISLIYIKVQYRD
jgi:hypothetical protein